MASNIHRPILKVPPAAAAISAIARVASSQGRIAKAIRAGHPTIRFGGTTVSLLAMTSRQSAFKLATPTGTAILEGELKEGTDISEAAIIANAALAVTQRGWHPAVCGPAGTVSLTFEPYHGDSADSKLIDVVSKVVHDRVPVRKVACLVADSTGMVATWSTPWRRHRVNQLQLSTHLMFAVLTPASPRYWWWLLRSTLNHVGQVTWHLTGL